MQPYRFTVRLIPGKENIAGTLSHRLADQIMPKLSTKTEVYVRFVPENATPSALSTREIQRALAVDKELSSIGECIQKG